MFYENFFSSWELLLPRLVLIKTIPPLIRPPMCPICQYANSVREEKRE